MNYTCLEGWMEVAYPDSSLMLTSSIIFFIHKTHTFCLLIGQNVEKESHKRLCDICVDYVGPTNLHCNLTCLKH